MMCLKEKHTTTFLKDGAKTQPLRCFKRPSIERLPVPFAQDECEGSANLQATTRSNGVQECLFFSLCSSACKGPFKTISHNSLNSLSCPGKICFSACLPLWFKEAPLYKVELIGQVICSQVIMPSAVRTGGGGVFRQDRT